MNNIEQAYDSDSAPVEHILGTSVSPADPDRLIIEPWANTVPGPILDVGSGTGRWTGHLAQLGHEVTGLEPAQRLVRLARQTYPDVTFQHGAIAELEPGQRWAGILAWYSVIHLSPTELPGALSTLRGALQEGGTMLLSFFAGPVLQAFPHPVARAYRWPMHDMVRALTEAGFHTSTQYAAPAAPHAYVIAHADDPGSTS